MPDAFETGLDRTLRLLRGEDLADAPAETRRLLRQGRLGLITHPAAVTADLTSGIDALMAAGARLVALFGPEHGVRGDAQAGEAVADERDARTGLPSYSLYGARRSPTAEMLAGLDALVYDVQDVGARCYTFISTLTLAMEAAAARHLPVIVLDRPNPIGGALEGPMLERAHASFVGRHPMPLRYGLTPAEVALTAHRVWQVGEPPHVVPMSGWRRAAQWTALGRPWIPPSPNIPTVDTALVYPGTVLFEGTNISEGRGTTLPFHLIGAPWADGAALADELNAAALPGARFRYATFEPTMSKYVGETCLGIALHVLDAREFRPVLTGVALLAAFRRRHADRFQWRGRTGSVAVDRLAGTSRVREALDAGEDPRAIAAEWEGSVAQFDRLAVRWESYA